MNVEFLAQTSDILGFGLRIPLFFKYKRKSQRGCKSFLLYIKHYSPSCGASYFCHALPKSRLTHSSTKRYSSACSSFIPSITLVGRVWTGLSLLGNFAMLSPEQPINPSRVREIIDGEWFKCLLGICIISHFIPFFRLSFSCFIHRLTCPLQVADYFVQLGE